VVCAAVICLTCPLIMDIRSVSTCSVFYCRCWSGFFFPPLRCFCNCCLVLCFVFYGKDLFRIVDAMALSRQLGLENFASLIDFFVDFGASVFEHEPRICSCS